MEHPPSQEIYRMFRRCPNTEPENKRNELLNRLYKITSDASYRDGEVAHIIKGGVIDEGFTGLPTGILKIPPLHVLHWKYSEIDWEMFLNHSRAISSPRFLYLATVLQSAFRRKTATPESFSSGLMLLHLNSYLRVPLYASGAIRGAAATVNHSYGFPGTYAAEVFENAEGTLQLSDCTVDVIREREKREQIYNRGYLFRLPELSSIFYFDRRANIKLQNAFVRFALKDQGLVNLSPNPDRVKRHADSLHEALNSLTGTEFRKSVEKYLSISRSLGYSILGFCLFELLHEFLSDRYEQIHSVNGILQRLDPKQSMKWSTRGFSIRDVETLENILNEEVKPGRDEESAFDEFCVAFCAEAPLRLRAFVFDGEDEQDVFRECAFNCEFFKTSYKIESSGKSLASHADLSRLLNTIADAMGSHLLRIMAAANVGSVCIPFQPDNRGEFLITPRITRRPDLRVDRVRLDLSSDPHRVIVEEQGIEANVLVQSFDRDKQAFYFADYLASDPQRQMREYREKQQLIEPVLKAKAEQLAAWILKKKVIAVVVPFYKEKTAFVDVAVHSAKAIKKLGYTPLVILASNQPTFPPLNGASHTLPESVGLVERALGSARIGRLWEDYFSVAIQTDIVNGIGHWMIEKFMNIHASAKLITLLMEKRVSIQNVAFLEGDVEDVSQWWKSLSRGFKSLPDVTILEFDVGVRAEGSTNTPTSDLHSSDSVLARFIAEPLTNIVLGVPLRNIFGGSYLMAAEAVREFVCLLDHSKHKESLVESWLLDLPRSCSVGGRYVGRKTHLPALKEHLFSTDDKFIKWTMDLFAMLHRFEQAGRRVEKRKFHPRPGALLIRLDPMNLVYERIVNAHRNYGFCSEIYKRVLSEQQLRKWSAKAESLLNWAQSNQRDGKPAAVAEELWTETLECFYRTSNSTAQNNQEEVIFALKILFDFLITSLGCEGTFRIPPRSLKRITRQSIFNENRTSK